MPGACLALAVCLAAPSAAPSSSPTSAPVVAWAQLEPGLELARVSAPQRSSHGDSTFTILRIDPRRQQLRLLMASELGGGARTAPDWAREHGLRAVVNASMFQAGERADRSVFLMQSASHVNNPTVGKENAVLAFDPVDGSVAPAQIIDRRCQDFPRLRKKYRTQVQGIRMVSCKGRNTWSPQLRKWSMVVVAADQHGHILFIFTRSPYPVHAFVDMLLALPLDLRNMMYLEGGPEASLFVDAGGRRVDAFGSYETGFFGSDGNDRYWPIPNVIGVAPRQAAKDGP